MATVAAFIDDMCTPTQAVLSITSDGNPSTDAQVTRTDFAAHLKVGPLRTYLLDRLPATDWSHVAGRRERVKVSLEMADTGSAGAMPAAVPACSWASFVGPIGGLQISSTGVATFSIRLEFMHSLISSGVFAA